MISDRLLLIASVLVGPALAGSCREAGLCCKGRDSSCVVQKAPLNAIIEDLDDRPCYCDHACLQLGDCCPDLKEACNVVDCAVSEWSAWSDCNMDCGPGVMKRARSVVRLNLNGGADCPPLVQRRGCLGTDCPNNPRSALKETAMLLPATLAFSRRSNETDITKNLRLRYPKDQLEEQRQEYCVQFKVLKSSKGCRKLKDYSSLREGEVQCVRCEHQAMRRGLGYRCPGHGTMERATRWTALSAAHCHGQWERLGMDHHHAQAHHAHHGDDSCSYCPDRAGPRLACDALWAPRHICAPPCQPPPPPFTVQMFFGRPLSKFTATCSFTHFTEKACNSTIRTEYDL